MKNLKTFEGFNTKRKIYFAHPINTYYTEYEEKSINILENEGFDVFNPGTKEQQEKFKIYRMENPTDYYMKYFKMLVDSCDDSAYLPFRDGKIGAGIVYEVTRSNKNGGNIYEVNITNNTLNKVNIEHVLENQLSIEDTRSRIKSEY